ncbi:MAG: transketolase [Hymenobacteraceae bacterium]|nr:transketolase [Hymenobacteraceae bacterium]
MAASADLDQLCINTIRTLSLDGVQKAESGHPGLPLGMAPSAYVLWTRHLRHNPKNPKWANRDRFLLSAGHGSMLIYSLLHLTGYDLPLDELKNFRQMGSKTAGHPEYHLTPGIELTTGPLGQGFANGVGFGMGGAHLGARFNTTGFPLIDHYVYCICSDGDLMEGVACEAASLAGTLALGNLIYLYDDNHITIEGDTSLAFREDVLKRFDALGWHTQRVSDGNDVEAIDAAIKAAQAETNRPSLIAVRTIIGFGMPAAGTRKAHSDAPGADAVKATKKNLGWPEDAQFLIPDEALAHFRTAVTDGAKREQEWNILVDRYEAANAEQGAAWRRTMAGTLPDGWEKALPTFADAKPMATRAASGEVINALAKVLPQLIGGSADLAPSNNTDIKDGGSFGPDNYAGRILHFGIREHAMGATLNGISLNGGLIPFGGTFMCFSDYMKPAVRLAALSGLQVIFVFTHDSIGLGEDGPTHQPIEQLAGLRAIPQHYAIRPADPHETRAAWKIAIERQKLPTSLILSRQKTVLLDQNTVTTKADEGVARGAYILQEADGGAPKVILMATGSEVGIALQARESLQAAGTPTRVVSMPCWERFEEQDAAYKETVLPRAITARVGIEAGARLGWDRYTGFDGAVICMEGFGASAPGDEVLKHFGFTPENIVEQARKVLG